MTFLAIRGNMTLNGKKTPKSTKEKRNWMQVMVLYIFLRVGKINAQRFAIIFTILHNDNMHIGKNFKSLFSCDYTDSLI